MIYAMRDKDTMKRELLARWLAGEIRVVFLCALGARSSLLERISLQF